MLHLYTPCFIANIDVIIKLVNDYCFSNKIVSFNVEMLYVIYLLHCIILYIIYSLHCAYVDFKCTSFYLLIYFYSHFKHGAFLCSI